MQPRAKVEHLTPLQALVKLEELRKLLERE